MADQEQRDGASEREPKHDRNDRSRQASRGDRSAGARKPYEKRDGERKPYAKRDGERKPFVPRDGERKPYEKRDGERKPYVGRDGDRKPYEQRDGQRKPYEKRDGDRKPYAKRDGDRKPFTARDGDRKPYQKREGTRDASGRPTRGGAGRPDRATRPEEIRAVRPRHDDPAIPDDITPQDLHPSARNELKTLSKENAEGVARHLAMAAKLIDDDPALAHEHALSASRRAGRIAVVRETLAITAYATGDYALALRELRTYRRISGSDDQIALLVDSERGVGRPDRALEAGRAVERTALPAPVRVELAIAMSGARLDLGEPERALLELDIPELDPDRAFEWSPALFAARAAVLEELGRDDEAAQWQRRAVVAADALDAASGAGDLETVIVEEIFESDDASDDEPAMSVALAPVDVDVASTATAGAGSIDGEVAEIPAEAGIDEEDDA
ncbi:primosomal protein [Microbacterium sp. NPDC055910]|uniref:primosomal protein n=1 Tax=Microbacterium sp. NPDC055910 TaxID=3345659 RepID=UPI0035E13C1E